MEPKKIVEISLALASALLFFLLRQLTAFVWDMTALPYMDEWVVSLPDLIALVVAVAAFFITKGSQAAMDFLQEVVVELKKVTYPLKKEAVTSAFVVIVMVGIASIVLFVFDSLWGTMTQSFLAA